MTKNVPAERTSEGEARVQVNTRRGLLLTKHLSDRVHGVGRADKVLGVRRHGDDEWCKRRKTRVPSGTLMRTAITHGTCRRSSVRRRASLVGPRVCPVPAEACKKKKVDDRTVPRQTRGPTGSMRRARVRSCHAAARACTGARGANVEHDAGQPCSLRYKG